MKHKQNISDGTKAGTAKSTGHRPWNWPARVPATLVCDPKQGLSAAPRQGSHLTGPEKSESCRSQTTQSRDQHENESLKYFPVTL